MTTRTFPAITPNESSWELIANTRQFKALSGAIQVEQRAGQRWMATLQFRNLKASDRRTLQGFVVQVLGLDDNFTLHDHSYTRGGSGSGTPVTSGTTSAGATSLSMIGGPVSQTDYLVAGDQFSVGGELKMVTQDVDTDGSGNATINFMPEVRGDISGSTSIDLTDPTGIFRFPEQRMGWSSRPGVFSDFTIIAIEDILA